VHVVVLMFFSDQGFGGDFISGGTGGLGQPRGSYPAQEDFENLRLVEIYANGFVVAVSNRAFGVCNIGAEY
jgi:hypothetical protein